MDTTGVVPVLVDADTVYAVKSYSELVGNAINGGKSPYRPDIDKTTPPNWAPAAAQATPVWLGGTEITFVAKKHGSVWVTISGLGLLPAGGYQAQLYCEIRTGLSGGGTRVHLSAVVTESLIWYSAVGANMAWVQNERRYLVTGLTPGQTYYARPMGSTDSSAGKINYPCLKIEY